MSHRGGPRRVPFARAAAGIALAAVAATAAAGDARTPAAAQPAGPIVGRVHLALVLRDGPGPGGFVPPPTSAATPGPSPTASATPEPTATATATRTPAPTADPRRVAYPTDPATIVLQVGQSETEQDGPAWEEMNGTPYLTVYGDGRVLAARRLHAAVEALHEARVDDARIQSWLVPITYDVQLFTLAERYDHPDSDHFAAHVYVRYGPDEEQRKRVSVGGLRRWLEDPLPDVPEAGRIRLLAERLVALGDFTTDLDDPYAPEAYTVIAHEINGTGTAPRWPLTLDVLAISNAAPLRPSGGNPHGPPGHRVVDAALGAEVRATTVADARRDFPGFNFAARYRVGTRYVVVGARPEVPGGSLFLPQRLHEQWYRRDG